MQSSRVEELVSIVIPARNVDFLLEKCIYETRNLYPQVKIILILDDINKTFDDKNIIVLKSIKTTMSAKRNQGVKEANTKYIAFTDSDAYPQENWLENSISFLEKNEEYCLATGVDLCPPTDTLQQKCLRIVRFNRFFTEAEWGNKISEKEQSLDCTKFMTSNAILKKDIFLLLGGFDENIYLAEDNEFSERLVKNRFKMRLISNVVVFHRECTFIPFFKKIYAMSYYYANMFVRKKAVKSVKKTLFQLFPLFAVFSFALIFILLNYNMYLLILPLGAMLLLLRESILESRKLRENKLKGIFILFCAFCTFCFVWVLGSLFGLLNFPLNKVQNYYKHY